MFVGVTILDCNVMGIQADTVWYEFTDCLEQRRSQYTTLRNTIQNTSYFADPVAARTGESVAEKTFTMVTGIPLSRRTWISLCRQTESNAWLKSIKANTVQRGGFHWKQSVAL